MSITTRAVSIFGRALLLLTPLTPATTNADEPVIARTQDTVQTDPSSRLNHRHYENILRNSEEKQYHEPWLYDESISQENADKQFEQKKDTAYFTPLTISISAAGLISVLLGLKVISSSRKKQSADKAREKDLTINIPRAAFDKSFTSEHKKLIGQGVLLLGSISTETTQSLNQLKNPIHFIYVNGDENSFTDTIIRFSTGYEQKFIGDAFNRLKRKMVEHNVDFRSFTFTSMLAFPAVHKIQLLPPEDNNPESLSFDAIREIQRILIRAKSGRPLNTKDLVAEQKEVHTKTLQCLIELHSRIDRKSDSATYNLYVRQINQEAWQEEAWTKIYKSLEKIS